MPKEEERLKVLRGRIAKQQQKLEDLSSARRLKALIQANKEKSRKKWKLICEKKQAHRDRCDETHAKVIIGAGVLLLPHTALVRTMRETSALLTGRDRRWIEGWLQGRGIDVADTSVEANASNETQSASDIIGIVQQSAIPFDQVGEALKAVIRSLGEAEFTLLIPEILAYATREQREVLETWFVQMHQV